MHDFKWFFVSPYGLYRCLCMLLSLFSFSMIMSYVILGLYIQRSAGEGWIELILSHLIYGMCGLMDPQLNHVDKNNSYLTYTNALLAKQGLNVVVGCDGHVITHILVRTWLDIAEIHSLALYRQIQPLFRHLHWELLLGEDDKKSDMGYYAVGVEFSAVGTPWLHVYGRELLRNLQAVITLNKWRYDDDTFPLDFWM